MLTTEQWNLLLDIEQYFDVVSLPQLPGLWLDGYLFCNDDVVSTEILWPVDEKVLAELVELGYVWGSEEWGYGITVEGMGALGI